MNYLLDRLTEPSTWSSITAFLGATGVSLDPGMAKYIAFVGMGVAGIAGILVKEASAKK